MADHPSEPAEFDPFVVPEASPRGRRALTVAAFLLALASLFNVWPFLLGPVGMASGLVAHVKGDRLGFAAAVTAGVLMMIGMAIGFLFFNAAPNG